MTIGVWSNRGGSSVPALVASFLVATGTAAVVRADLTVGNWQLTTRAETQEEGGLTDVVPRNAGGDNPDPVALPLAATDSAVVAGGSGPNLAASTAGYDFSVAGNSGLFEFDFSQMSGAFVGTLAEGTGTLVFTPAVTSTFALTGGYVQTGSGSILMHVSLSEFVGGAELFVNEQDSDIATDQALTLGGSGGTANVNSGSMAGTLQAGTTYRLFYDFLIEGNGEGDGFSALGNLGLRIAAEATIVPVPPAAGLALAGLGLLFALRRIA